MALGNFNIQKCMREFDDGRIFEFVRVILNITKVHFKNGRIMSQFKYINAKVSYFRLPLERILVYRLNPQKEKWTIVYL